MMSPYLPPNSSNYLDSPPEGIGSSGGGSIIGANGSMVGHTTETHPPPPPPPPHMVSQDEFNENN